jgi:hypothetical protein
MNSAEKQEIWVFSWIFVNYYVEEPIIGQNICEARDFLKRDKELVWSNNFLQNQKFSGSQAICLLS